jgi:hypothetical protein
MPRDLCGVNRWRDQPFNLAWQPSQKAQTSILRSRIYLARHCLKQCLSIYSTNLYQWLKKPILQINRFAPTGGGLAAPTLKQPKYHLNAFFKTSELPQMVLTCTSRLFTPTQEIRRSLGKSYRRRNRISSSPDFI